MKKIERMQAVDDYMKNSIENSWTWERLTDAEKRKFYDVIRTATKDILKKVGNNKNDTFLLVMSLYGAFLNGIGYNSIGWRETDETPLF